MSSMLDEDLSISNDSDFSNIFSNPDLSPSDLDETVTVIGEDTSTSVEPDPVAKKRRGRPKKSETVEEEKEVKPVPVAAVPAKRRGRPAKKVVAQTVEENPEDETTVVEEKKPRSKRVSVDDFPPEVLSQVFEEYSLRPAAEIAKELDIQEKYIHKIIKRLSDLFEMEVSTGDLTQESFDKEIAPKLSEFHEPKDNFEAFVKTKVKSIKN